MKCHDIKSRDIKSQYTRSRDLKWNDTQTWNDIKCHNTQNCGVKSHEIQIVTCHAIKIRNMKCHIVQNRDIDCQLQRETSEICIRRVWKMSMLTWAESNSRSSQKIDVVMSRHKKSQYNTSCCTQSWHELAVATGNTQDLYQICLENVTLIWVEINSSPSCHVMSYKVATWKRPKSVSAMFGRCQC